MNNPLNTQSKFLNRMFRKVEGVVWDLSTQSIGLQNTNGIYTLTQTTTGGEPVSEGGIATPGITTFGVNVNPFDAFGFAIPAFAQITKLADVTIGDLVIGDKAALGWVTQVNERSLILLDQNGMTKNYTPPKMTVLNQDGALVVKSLTGLFGQQGATGFSNALLPMLLAGGDMNGMDDILPILLLTQQTSGDNSNALASALPTILMMKAMSGRNGNGGGMESMLLPMILSGGLGGGLGGGAGGLSPMMLVALSGGGLGGNNGGQFIAGGLPVPQTNPIGAIPPLTRTR